MMRRTFRCLAALIAVSAALLAAPGGGGTPAEAATFTYDLSFVFSGFIPVGPTPYLTLKIEDTAANQVTVTFTSHLTSGQFVTEWDFNSLVNPTTLTIAYVSGPVTSVDQTGFDCCKADGDGFYDLGFTFSPAPPGSRLDGNPESSVYTISCTGCDATDFNTVSNDTNFLFACSFFGKPAGESTAARSAFRALALSPAPNNFAAPRPRRPSAPG